MKLTSNQLRWVEWEQFAGLPSYNRNRRPFYYNSRGRLGAPSGWYQWAGFGSIYLGESILEDA